MRTDTDIEMIPQTTGRLPTLRPGAALKQQKLDIVCSSLILIFHLVGLAGFLTPSISRLFIPLVPYHLLLMGVLVIIAQPDRNKSFWIIAGFVAVAGFFVELLGIRTGAVFGNYYYGETLGLKLWGVPLIIGLNWMLLTISGASFAKWIGIRNRPGLVLAAALLLVVLDLLIEPVAVRFDYWHWKDGSIPLQNYVGWFFTAVMMFLVYYMRETGKVSLAALSFLACQFLFFIALNFSILAITIS